MQDKCIEVKEKDLQILEYFNSFDPGRSFYM